MTITVALSLEDELHTLRIKTFSHAQLHRLDTYRSPVWTYGERAVQCLVERRKNRAGVLQQMVGWRLDGRRVGVNALKGALRKEGWR